MIRLRSASPGPARVLLVGGASAGHLAPMVAVAEALEKLEPGITLAFACSDKPSDAAFLKLENRAGHALPLPRRNLALPFAFAQAFAASRRVLREERPDVVFSKGSAVSVPLCLAAWMNGIPVVLHESDAVMGWANRAVAMVATKVCLAVPMNREPGTGNRERQSSGPRSPVASASSIVTGNPVRSRILRGDKAEALRITGLSGTRPILLVMGGSQGARAINEAVAAGLGALLKVCDVVHLTGAGKGVAANKPGYYATEFGSDVLPHLYAAADLAVSRAGAGSIAELAACGIPAILVPIRGLAGDHQAKNAERAEAAGGCIVLPQERLAELPSLVASLLADAGRIQTMRAAARYASAPEASRLIAETVLRSVAREKTGA
jgi:UDP-N-acetylglucosamine--N-acetylmuramyl-(pentapeptide) pyrophosphoryl-undecaprenol N-acetylglucosamine transferase